MKPKALVVEDDDRIIDSIEDALFSIGHDHEWATNQHDAQQMLKAGDYAYVLLDLQIPAKPNRGGADKEFGVNLLADIQHIKGPNRLPVIVMTAHSADCLDLTTELFAGGASDFIAKPFSSNGRTLTKVIRKVLSDHERKAPAKTAKGNGDAPLAERPFDGGELVFYADRVELCGVPVVTDSRGGLLRAIIDELKHRNGAGRYVALSGPELVSRTKCRGGQNGIAGSIRDFRKNAADVLCECLGLVCGPQDIVRSGGPGYRFNEWISVRDATAANAGSRGGGDVPAKPGRDPANVPATAPADPANDPANDGDDPANQRRRQILSELRKDRKLRTPAIAKELGCSEKTVKRELDALRAEGHIEFVGPTKTGYYRLKK
jgi:DNA-binding response OmpR family regulator/biotin operon repressor